MLFRKRLILKSFVRDTVSLLEVLLQTVVLSTHQQIDFSFKDAYRWSYRLYIFLKRINSITVHSNLHGSLISRSGHSLYAELLETKNSVSPWEFLVSL